MSVPFPEPTAPAPSRAEVFLTYLDYFRSRLVSKLEGLPSAELRRSRLPSGWTPIELIKHLAWVEMRWLEWGFEGRPVADPWGDQRDGRWYVAADETLTGLVAALDTQAARTRAIVESHDRLTSGSPASGGTEPSPRPSNGSCSTWSRSTRGTSASSTSPANWPAARPGSEHDGRADCWPGRAGRSLGQRPGHPGDWRPGVAAVWKTGQPISVRHCDSSAVSCGPMR
jgi:hypothetical protein